MMYIYGLHEKGGHIRYIGQTYNLEGRLREHWLGRDVFGYRPLSMWLRTLTECPEMIVLKTLPDAWPNSPEANAAETAYILAARREWPGRMLNVRPWLPEGSPEWAVWDKMARLDDPDFVRPEKSSPQEQMRRLWTDPNYRAMKSAEARALWNDPKFRADHSIVMKALWNDPEFREMKSAELKNMWGNPGFRAMCSAAAKALWNDPGFRERQSAGQKAYWADPDSRTRQSENAKALWDDPEFRERQSAKTHAQLVAQWANPEYRVKMEANGEVNAKAQWADPEARARKTAGLKYGSLAKPCKGCGCPPLEFTDDCDRCRKRRQHPYLAERLREAG